MPDVAVIFAGLPDSYESEGYDRKHLGMPNCQNALIEAVAEAQPNTIVVLHNGAPIEMPWLGKVKAVLEAYLGGQAVGGAVVNVLRKCKSKRTIGGNIPTSDTDTPCYLNYGGEHDKSVYSEGVFVGYRYTHPKKWKSCSRSDTDCLIRPFLTAILRWTKRSLRKVKNCWYP